ncbi:HlyD family secretion protein [Rhizobium sp. SG570]|nr:HlyD family secretion protein [Rhizobium sp. SG570]
MAVDGYVKKVQHPDGGTVSELLVQEGQMVRAGETIIRLDTTAVGATLAATEKNIQQLHARQARLEAERDGLDYVATPAALKARLDVAAEAAMASERRLFDDRRSSRDGQKSQIGEQVEQLREQIKGLAAQQQAKDDEIGFIEKELEGKRRLYAMGAMTLSQVNTLDRNAARLRGERGQVVALIASARGQIAELELRRIQVDQDLRTEVAGELRDTENKLATLAEDEVTARDKLRHAEIKAPISGAVHLLSIHTVGGVITPAETLMELVPQGGALTVEARISPQDIDQIALAQPATLRLTAFNRNTTPELQGSVSRVSADLETDKTTGASFYRAGVAIPESEAHRLGDLALVPGMPVETFIRTGDRKVISYFTKPIRDHMQRVFREE